VIDTLIDGTFDDHGTGMFRELYDALIHGRHWHRPDHYFLLKDFESYAEAHENINKAYEDKVSWAKKCWINMCNSGKFSSDRSVREYADIIWKIDSISS